MYIHQAAQSANRNGLSMRRESWGIHSHLIVIPTNTRGCCYLDVADGTNRNPGRRWTPSLDDLTANDWVICD